MKPCYQLTKTETLYIATKFNDEARAKLVLRWEELERQAMVQTTPSPSYSGGELALPSPKKILALADEIMGEGLRMLNEPAEDTLTATQVAKTFKVHKRNRPFCVMASGTTPEGTGYTDNIHGCVFAMPGANVTQQAAPPKPPEPAVKTEGEYPVAMLVECCRRGAQPVLGRQLDGGHLLHVPRLLQLRRKHEPV